MRRRLLSALLVTGLVPIAALTSPAGPVSAVSDSIVISQVYGGGGNTGAPYTNDYVELFNRSAVPVSLSGWSVQYASATGTGNFSSNSPVALAGSVPPGGSYLVQLAGGAVGAPLPAADATGSISMSATGGKVIVANVATGLACNGSSTPCSAEQLAQIVDLVGFGSANFFEGTAAPAPSNTTAISRVGGGCTDTDTNGSDFTAGAPAPRNSSTTPAPCAPVGPIEPLINEFSASTAGTDVEYVEIVGSPAVDYSAYAVLEVEGDVSGTVTGTVDEVIAVGSTDAAGLYLASLAANALENGTVTLLLVEGFTGALGDDLDTNDDGVLDVTPWTEVVDAVAVGDGGTGDLTYGTPTLGVSYDGQLFAPGGASRIPDGADTDTTADWVRNDFDLAGIAGFPGTPVPGEALNTPGAANVAVTVDTATVTVTATDAVAGEPADPGTFTIARTGDTAAALDVGVAIGGTASTSDYTPTLVSPVTIPAGAASVDVVITPVDDGDAESLETVTVTVQSGAGYVVGAPSSAEVAITDDDGAGPVITRIHDIQGAVAATGTFTAEAVVTASYQAQGSGQLRGFFVQEEDTDVDADPATSEGIFVFCSTCPVAVAVGDLVQVTGPTSEFFDMSQINATTAASTTVLSSGNPLPGAAALELPVPGVPTGDLAAATAAINAYYERTEGMRVTFPDSLAVSEYFELARYGQIILTEGGRPRTFTDANVPTAAGLVDHEIDLARRTVIVDDGDNVQNRMIGTPNTSYPHPLGGLSTTNLLRGGDQVTGLTGVLHWSFAGQTGTDAWRIRPESYDVVPANPRTGVPDVGGRLTVASFNVLNYFLTVDTTASNDVGTCGPTGTADCRGADSAAELDRQRTKLLTALEEIDADVFGFMEMENSPGVEPLADIVAGLPGYDFVDTGVIGTDAIRVGMIYDATTVTPVGDFAILEESIDPRFNTLRNRPALAQTFEENATGARFTVIVNHLKSKGSGCGVGDDDTTTGQGNCNGTRTLAAQALADWAAADPTGTGEGDVLVIGDLNSYAQEDPIRALVDAGYTDLVREFGGSDAYGYVFDGQIGYLDHALANTALRPQVTGVGEWHINADEVPLFDFNDDVRDPGEAAFEEESDVFPLYSPDPYRTSDHDPVLIGLDLTVPSSVTAEPSSQDVQYTDAITEIVITASGQAPLSLVTDPLPAGLVASVASCTGDTCTWTISGTPDVDLGSYSIAGAVTDGAGASLPFTATIDVVAEDARATSTGPRTVATTGTTSARASVLLAATVRDVAVTPDASGDSTVGDIGTARVTFVDRATGTPIAGCTDLPVGAVDDGTGTAACRWPVTISGSTQTFTVGVVVSGNYARDASADDVTITVRRPARTHSAAGAATIRLADSAGAIAGDGGSLAGVTFAASYVRAGRELQGAAVVLVRRLESDGNVHVYSIATTSVTALTVASGPRTATLDGVATITDVTNPLSPVPVATGALVQLALDDNGTRGTTDTVGVTVWDPAGGLWFSSRFDGVRTVVQRLTTGNLTVR